MTRVTIWTLESKHDKDVVQHIVEKMPNLVGRELSIRSVYTKPSSRPKRGKGQKRTRRKSLAPAVRNYLKADDYVIFVIDTDGLIASHQRRQEPNSYINQVNRVLNDKEFKGKVFLTEAVTEIESWLLVDCAGIFCYFAGKKPQTKGKTRQVLLQNNTYHKLIDKYQRGDTEHLGEVEYGGKGAKEYLEKFSEAILRTINSNMSDRNVRNERYTEKFSPDIAKEIVINNKTLGRNRSLKKFSITLCKRSDVDVINCK